MTNDYFYVITPVRSDPDFDKKNRVLREVGAGYKCVPFFPFEHIKPYSIDCALEHLRTAQFVLADLSHERPSCYFELGLAQAVGTPVIIIAENGTSIHQIGDTARVLWYSCIEEYRETVNKILAQFAKTYICGDTSTRRKN